MNPANKNMMSYAKGLMWVSLLATLAACNVPTINEQPPQAPEHWFAQPNLSHERAGTQSLKSWWKNFNDPVLEGLIDDALKNNPDLRQAAAKVVEARGHETSAFAEMLPKIDAKASADKQRTTFFAPVTGSDRSGSFDASYELDLFGKNREAYKAADSAATASEQDYAWAKLSMIAEVARDYASMRAQEKKLALAKKNLAIQKNTLDLVKRQYTAGGTSEFDVERAALQVSQSRAGMDEYQRQRNVYFLALITLTGLEPEALEKRLKPGESIPGLDLTVMADSPAKVLAQRPDIAAAGLRFTQATALKKSQAAAIFPDISLSGFFGFSKTILVNSTSIWSFTASASMPILDFGRIQGQIDAASAREVQAFEAWRKAIFQGIQDVETSLNNVARIHDQRLALATARDHAAKAWTLAQTRYKAGDISLLDALEAQHQLNDADSALVDAESNYVTSVIALYKAIGQY